VRQYCAQRLTITPPVRLDVQYQTLAINFKYTYSDNIYYISGKNRVLDTRWCESEVGSAKYVRFVRVHTILATLFMQ